MQLHYTTTGEGPPIVALHGFAATSYAWRYLLPALAERHRVYLVDLKGHGASPRPADNHYSLEDHANCVLAIIRECNLSNVTLMGSSLGGGISLFVALKLAQEGDRRLSKLVLLDSAYEMNLPLFIKILRIPILGYISMSILPARLRVKLALRSVTVAHRHITPDVVDAYAINYIAPGGKAALIQTARQLKPNIIEEVAQKINDLDIPTLIIWGREDPLIDLSIGQRLHAALKHSQFVIIEGCGHLPHEEQPEKVLAALREFFAERLIARA